MTNPFQTREPNIIGNSLIRTPQREAYAAVLAMLAPNPMAEQCQGGTGKQAPQPNWKTWL